MSILNKDLPECKERIENNYSLLSEIKDILKEEEQMLFDNNCDTAESCNAVHEDDYPAVSEKILAHITEFVNENYEWKGRAK